MRFFIILFYLSIILLGVTFAALNATSVTVNLYVTTLSMPISVWMTVMFGIGVVCGFLFFVFRLYRAKCELRKIKHALELKEKEVNNLRKIPYQKE